MSKNKWSFRRIIKKVNRILEGLKLKKAEAKTFIGKIERGFDFLGFYFSPDGMSVNKKCIKRFAKNIVARIYDSRYCQEKFNIGGYIPNPDNISHYIQRWISWVKSIYGKEKVNLPETGIVLPAGDGHSVPKYRFFGSRSNFTRVLRRQRVLYWRLQLW